MAQDQPVRDQECGAAYGIFVWVSAGNLSASDGERLIENRYDILAETRKALEEGTRARARL